MNTFKIQGAHPQASDAYLQGKVAGRKAFRMLGVTGKRTNPYVNMGEACLGFQDGFEEEKNAACARAGDEAVAYHKLSVRDAPKDRAWAEKFAARAAQGA